MTDEPRFECTLTAVMWTDAFLSAALAIASLIGGPILIVTGVPSGAQTAFGVGAIVLCVVLAACGAITYVLIVMRMHDGDYLLPKRLRLPLPSRMRPPLGGQPEETSEAESSRHAT